MRATGVRWSAVSMNPYSWAGPGERWRGRSVTASRTSAASPEASVRSAARKAVTSSRAR